MIAKGSKLGTVVFLGDSITEDPAGYVAICSERLAEVYPGVQVVNAGIGGNKASDLLARLDRDVLAHRPDLVLISVGINDVWHGFHDFEADRPLDQFDSSKGLALQEFESCLVQILEKLRDVPVMLIAPTVIGNVPSSRENALLRRYVEAMERLASRFGAGYCPMHDLYWEAHRREPHGKLTWDGVHMLPDGARMMAEGVLGCLGLGK